MGLLEDARTMAEHTPVYDMGDHVNCCHYCDQPLYGAHREPLGQHADDCPWLSMPRIVAALEATERVQEPATVEETAVGPALVYAGCDRRIEQGHAPDCEHQALREALDA